MWSEIPNVGPGLLADMILSCMKGTRFSTGMTAEPAVHRSPLISSRSTLLPSEDYDHLPRWTVC